MFRLFVICFVTGITASGFCPARGCADVVVVANRSGHDITFTASAVDGIVETETISVETRALVPIATRGKIDVAFWRGNERVNYRLDANSAYFFAGEGGQLDLRKIGLGGDARTFNGRDLASDRGLTTIGAIPIKILVDDEQRYTRRVWENTLRERVKKASAIVEHHCRLRLEVVGVGTWDSDDRVHDFQESLAEFAREVEPGPARVAIGFTSQFQIPHGQFHLGGTRGPLQPHILIREWSQYVTEAERLEILVHELGHHLGAAHSPEPDSVMRPKLGDRQARRRSFAIGFDPVNTLAMYLMAEEIRLRGITRIAELTKPTKLRLFQVYSALDQATPNDPAAATYRRILVLN